MNFPQYIEPSPRFLEAIVISLLVTAPMFWFTVRYSKAVSKAEKSSGRARDRYIRSYIKSSSWLDKIVIPILFGVIIATFVPEQSKIWRDQDEKVAYNRYYSEIVEYLEKKHELKADVEDMESFTHGGLIKSTDAKGRFVVIALVDEGSANPQIIRPFYAKL